jgi:hypothetical protein
MLFQLRVECTKLYIYMFMQYNLHLYTHNFLIEQQNIKERLVP